MREINEDMVEATWNEVSEFEMEQTATEMLSAGEKQPELLNFVVGMTEDLSEEAQELAIYMFFIIYRMFQQNVEAMLDKADADQIHAAHERNCDLMDTLDDEAEPELVLQALRDSSAQPHVLDFVTDALLVEDDEEDSIALEEEETGDVYLTLKTVIDVLDLLSEGQ